MARAVDVFRINAIERERLEGEAAQRREKELERQRHLDRYLQSFKGTITENIEILSAGSLGPQADLDQSPRGR